MVTFGVDAHKRTLTLVFIDDAGRKLGERTVAAARDGHLDPRVGLLLGNVSSGPTRVVGALVAGVAEQTRAIDRPQAPRAFCAAVMKASTACGTVWRP
jgi:hypothetical protein